MNSNVVYASVCRNGAGDGGYAAAQPVPQQYNGGAADPIPSYYHHQQTPDRLMQPAGPSYLPTTLMTPYSNAPELRTPPLHPAETSNSHPTPHQIISDSNGLSYTNLDQSHFHQQQHHHQRMGHTTNPTPTYHHHHHPYSADVPPRNLAYVHPYRNVDYSYEIGAHQTPDHPQGVPIGPEGARVVTGFGVAPSTYPYLDSLNLSRRNGYGGYENYDPALRESCQMNGGYQYGSPVHRTRMTTTQPTPMPTYKWMQVKRSVPKPSKSVLILYVESMTCASYISSKQLSLMSCYM